MKKTKKKRILVVEDEAIVAKDIQVSLQSLGYEVPYTFIRGEDALESLRNDTFDLVLMDIRLKGGLDGIATATLIKEQYHIPVIFLTAYSDDLTLKRSKVTGPFGYLLKPFDEKDLQITIEIALYRHHMEAEIIESQRRYKQLFDANPHPMCVFDTATLEILAVNNAQVKKYGYTKEEFLTMTILDIRPEEYHDSIKKIVKETTDKLYYLNQSVHQKKNGEIMIVEITSHEIVWDERAARVVLANDITDRLKAEEKLKNSEERFRALVENSSEALVLVDKEANILYSGPSTKRVLGYRNEFIGKNVMLLIHPGDVQRVRKTFKKLIENPNKTFMDQYRVQHKNGSWIWIEGTARNLLHEKNVEAVVVNYRDITKRKEALIALEESEDRYRKLIQLSPEAIIVHTDVIQLVNNAALKILGATNANELIGRNFSDIVHPKYREICREELLSHSTAGDKSELREAKLLKVDGNPVDVEIARMAFAWEHGVSYQAVFHDITTRKKNEEAIRFQAHLLDTVGRGVVAFDLKGTTIYWNSYAEKLYGWSKKEAASGDVRLQQITTMNQPQLQTIIDYVGTGKTWSGEFMAVRKDGSLFPAWSTTSGIYNSEGLLIGVLCITRDYSRQKLLDEALHKRLRQQAIISQIGQMAIVSNETSKLMKRASRRVCSTLHAELCLICMLEDDMLVVKAVGGNKSIDISINDVVSSINNAPIANRSLENNEIITFDSASTTNGYAIKLMNTYQLSNGICVPIGTNDRRLGVMYIFSKEKYHFDQDDKYFLTLMTNILANAFERNKIEDALRISELHIRRLKESNSIGILVTNTKNVVCEANSAFLKLVGYSQEDVEQRLLDIEKLTPEEYHPLDEKARKELLVSGAAHPYEKDLVHRSGKQIPVQIGAAMLDSKTKTVISYVIDLSRLKQTEEALRDINQTLEALIEFSPLGVISVDRNLHATIWNPAAERIYGWRKNEIIGKKLPDIFETNDGVSISTSLHKSGKFTDVEVRQQRKDGSSVDISISAAPLLDEKEQVYGSVAVINDITEKKIVEKKVHSLAFYDQLTKLPNRTLFRSRLTYALAEARRNRTNVAVMYIDLDRFKNINDSLGHEAGDKLLKEVGKRLKQTVRETDTVARLGGDEFALIVTDLDEGHKASLIGEKILSALAKPVQLDKHEIFITPSIGISLYPHDSKTDEELIMYADVAMYTAKREGKNRYHFYTSGMNTKVFERMIMDNNLRYALERNEFELYYQPKVDIETGRITSMEALIRWHHPEFGLVSPNVFIPLAEETGLIEPLGEWILCTACRQLKEWHDAGYRKLTMAVNLSVHQFRQKISDLVGRVVSDAGIDPHFLELEITESSIMASDEMVITMLQELRRSGVTLSIDDFGTGYSSLSRLSSLPVDTLKIDQSFIRNLKVREDSEPIVKAIIAVAQSLGLKVIAEGVETLEQVQFLHAQGCINIQGYFISPPVPSQDFVPLIKKSFKPQLQASDELVHQKRVAKRSK